MAKKLCDRCGVNISTDMFFGVNLCDECQNIRNQAMIGDISACEKIQKTDFFLHSTDQARKLFSGALEQYRNAILKKQKEEKERYAYENMLLTTGTCFDGFFIEKYIDVFCEEIILKNSLGERISAGFEDFVNALSFSRTEMTGANELISKAREYVMEKFKRKAVSLGANAILGIEFESSYGVDIIRISVSGTAVIIKKINNI